MRVELGWPLALNAAEIPRPSKFATAQSSFKIKASAIGVVMTIRNDQSRSQIGSTSLLLRLHALRARAQFATAWAALAWAAVLAAQEPLREMSLAPFIVV
jgi:hypothetical protein